jgi:hypothetical protein
MNNEEKITPIKNSEDHNRVVAKLEAEIEAEKQKALDWENACYKKDETILEIKKAKERAEREAEDWKKEARANRRIEQEQKQTKAQNDFKTEYLKLQEQKGWTWDEVKGWTKR